jgi:pimeloyl-ACP methyl ester carboxylesterase
MQTVTSKDGTTIAFEKVGRGPAVILVVGAFNDRQTGKPLAEALKSHFTVYNYDRRARGDSTDTMPYAVEREIEDLDALIADAGGSAYVFGYSSGAVLSLLAAAKRPAITKLALYDLPLMVGSDDSDQTRNSVSHVSELSALITEGRRGDAVEYYQGKVIGIPEFVIAQLRNLPVRPALEAMAQSLVYDATIMGDGLLPADLVPQITIPTLVVAGGASIPFMTETAHTLADSLANGQAKVLEGRTHDIVPDVLGPVLVSFYLS